MANPATLSVRLVRSLIGCKPNQVATAHALGLFRTGDASTQPDNAATRGKIRVLAHLLEVRETTQGGAQA
ncbi:MAG: 50S ribosomal protein L30 [Oscillospiraceae bacterium]|jgi:large subunit ribosomal protein L30|nr:50S ribosomal protein L30 [Oscillospiraceae bacterium]